MHAIRHRAILPLHGFLYTLYQRKRRFTIFLRMEIVTLQEQAVSSILERAFVDLLSLVVVCVIK